MNFSRRCLISSAFIAWNLYCHKELSKFKRADSPSESEDSNSHQLYLFSKPFDEIDVRNNMKNLMLNENWTSIVDIRQQKMVILHKKVHVASSNFNTCKKTASNLCGCGSVCNAPPTSIWTKRQTFGMNSVHIIAIEWRLWSHACQSHWMCAISPLFHFATHNWPFEKWKDKNEVDEDVPEIRSNYRT